MKSATVAQAAKHFGVDPATVRRWASQGCPTVRKGRRGPGHGAQLDLDAVATWRGRAGGSVGLTPHEALQTDRCRASGNNHKRPCGYSRRDFAGRCGGGAHRGLRAMRQDFRSYLPIR